MNARGGTAARKGVGFGIRVGEKGWPREGDGCVEGREGHQEVGTFQYSTTDGAPTRSSRKNCQKSVRQATYEKKDTDNSLVIASQALYFSRGIHTRPE